MFSDYFWTCEVVGTCGTYPCWALSLCRWPVETLWPLSASTKTNKKQFIISQEATESSGLPSLFKRSHTNLISCITFPGPLHDLLEALCRPQISELAADVFSELTDCVNPVLLLTFFLSSRSCSSFWKCFSLSCRWRSASSRAFASASSLWKKGKTWPK